MKFFLSLLLVVFPLGAFAESTSFSLELAPSSFTTAYQQKSPTIFTPGLVAATMFSPNMRFQQHSDDSPVSRLVGFRVGLMPGGLSTDIEWGVSFAQEGIRYNILGSLGLWISPFFFEPVLGAEGSVDWRLWGTNENFSSLRLGLQAMVLPLNVPLYNSSFWPSNLAFSLPVGVAWYY